MQTEPLTLRSSRTEDRSREAHRRWAFTLIELAVVVGIILTLTSIVVVSVNFAIMGDRVPSASRQVQSYLEGARDRAIFAKEARGVRFILDPNDNTVVTSMVYIGAPLETLVFELEFVNFDSDDDGTSDFGGDRRIVNYGFGSTGGTTPVEYNSPSQVDKNSIESWEFLNDANLIGPGTRIKISDPLTGAEDAATKQAMIDDALWYVIDAASFQPGNEVLSISAEHPNTGTVGNTPILQYPNPSNDITDNDIRGQRHLYVIELRSGTLPGQEPTLLSEGVVVDLDASSVPNTWKQASGNYAEVLDILFSPEGRVIGPEAAKGLIHLLICEQTDVLNREFAASQTAPTAQELQDSRNRLVGSPFVEGDEAVVTVFTRTGSVVTSEVFPLVDTDGDGNISTTEDDTHDPFRYAETGEAPLK